MESIHYKAETEKVLPDIMLVDMKLHNQNKKIHITHHLTLTGAHSADIPSNGVSRN